MARVVDLTGENVTRQRRKERNFGTKTDLPSTSVERGNTHWTDGSNVNIDGFLGIAGTASVSGTLRVTGLLDVTGTFNGSGTNNLDGTNNLSGDNNLTGPTEISGSLDVTGPTTIDGVLTINGDTSITGLLEVTGDTTLAGLVDITGNTTITGDLDVDGPTTITGTLGIEGITTLKNDLNVTTGGKIKAGSLEIEPANGGQINFANGSIAVGAFGLGIIHNTGVQLQGPTVDLNATNTNVSGAFDVGGGSDFAGRVIMRERLVLPGTPDTSNSSFLPNIHMDSSGFLYRTSWSPA